MKKEYNSFVIMRRIYLYNIIRQIFIIQALQNIHKILSLPKCCENNDNKIEYV